MNPVPLPATQTATIDTLEQADKLQDVAVDLEKAERFPEQSPDGVTEAPTITSTEIMHGTGDDATRDCSEAVAQRTASPRRVTQANT